MSNMNKYEDKIIKLLAKANNEATTQEESEAFAAAAMQLALKYAVDIDALSTLDKDSGKIVSDTFDVSNPYGIQRRLLAFRIYRANGCAGFYGPGRSVDGKRSYLMTFYGTRKNLDLSAMMFKSFSVQFDRAVLNAKAPSGMHGRTFRTGYAKGWVVGIYDALVKAGKLPEDKGGGLVLMSDFRKAEDEMNSRHRLAKGTDNAVNAYAYASGKADGGRSNFAASVAGGSRPALGR